ncbi:MAG TPA: exodeoxyribonuclease III [Pyrinomonadaceae bacterium]|nr:exodeoxyribonuclease III [Pyrinomonadaceae bacterium]
MKFATWNVNSIIARLPVVLEWLAARKPDVLCLQELKCTDEKFPRAAFAEIGYGAEVFGQPTYNGVAILSRGVCADVQRNFPGSGGQARMIAATIEGVRVVNVYVPNGAFVGSDKYEYKLQWLGDLRAYFDQRCEPDAPVLLCGDFNVAPEDEDVYDPELWRGKILFSEPEKAALRKVKDWGFVDAFRLFHKEEGLYSWWDYRMNSFRRNAGLRIDHIWVSDVLAQECAGATIDIEPRRWERPSDHTPVVVEINV